MADDLAFLFNDPAPPAPIERSTSRLPAEGSPRPQPHTAAALPAGIEWKTLREAHDETSIPVSTLRKWAKRGKVRARLVRENGQDLRLVAFGDVIDRARALERQVHPSQTVIDLRHPDRVAAVLETEEMAADERNDREADVAYEPLEEEAVSAVPEPAPAEAEPAEPVPDRPEETDVAPVQTEGVTVVPEGSILVPIDAWDRLLGQLGNLHEAGQQLAEARERAAKAETEAEFLRERLRDMRKRAEGAELAVDLQQRDRELPTLEERPEPILQTAWRRLIERLAGR